MSRTTTVSSLVVRGLIVSTLGCSPEVPAAPTYTRDVQPILAAHCVRCHDGNLTGAFDPVKGINRPPLQCHLNRYEDTGDCSNAATCSYGAASANCVALSMLYITAPEDSIRAMPPLPSDRLNDWELEVFKRWAAATPPAR